MGREKKCFCGQKYWSAGWRTASLVKVYLRAICSLPLPPRDLHPFPRWGAAPLALRSSPCAGSPCPPSPNCSSLHTAPLQTSLYGHLSLPLRGHLPSIWFLPVWLIFLFPVHSRSPSRLFPLSLSILIVLQVSVPRPFCVPEYAQQGWDNSVRVNTPVRIHMGLVRSS